MVNLLIYFFLFQLIKIAILPIPREGRGGGSTGLNHNTQVRSIFAAQLLVEAFMIALN